MKITATEIRQKLIEKGVENLKEFGYPSCDDVNILTDKVYSKFFLSMLKENLGIMGQSVDDVITKLISEIES